MMNVGTSTRVVAGQLCLFLPGLLVGAITFADSPSLMKE